MGGVHCAEQTWTGRNQGDADDPTLLCSTAVLNCRSLTRRFIHLRSAFCSPVPLPPLRAASRARFHLQAHHHPPHRITRCIARPTRRLQTNNSPIFPTFPDPNRTPKATHTLFRCLRLSSSAFCSMSSHHLASRRRETSHPNRLLRKC